MHVCAVFFGLVRTVQFFRVGWWPFRPFNLQQQGHHIGRPRIATGPRWYTSKHVQDGTGNTPNVSFSSMPAGIQQREEQRGRTKGKNKGNKETRKQRHKKTTIQQRQQYKMSDVFPAINFPIHTCNNPQRTTTNGYLSCRMISGAMK